MGRKSFRFTLIILMMFIFISIIVSCRREGEKMTQSLGSNTTVMAKTATVQASGASTIKAESGIAARTTVKPMTTVASQDGKATYTSSSTNNEKSANEYDNDNDNDNDNEISNSTESDVIYSEADDQQDIISYVASINNENITEAEFKIYLFMFRDQVEFGESFADNTDRKNFWEIKENGGKSLEDKIKSEILQYLYEQKICILKAKEEKIDLTSDEKAGIEKQINSIIEHGFSGKRINADEYYMKEYGATFEQYEEYMRNDMLSQKYRGFVFDSVKPSEAEILQIFEQDKDRYDKFSVRHILFLTQDLTAGKPLSEDLKQLAKKKADDMLARVKSEEDMKALAIANSEDTGVSQNGGEYIFNRYGMYEKDGRFTESSISSPLDQNFLNWSLNAKVGDVDIVKTQFGYHVIKLESRVPSVFNDVKNKISNEIANQRLENEIENWKKDSKYEIKINDEIYNRINMIE